MRLLQIFYLKHKDTSVSLIKIVYKKIVCASFSHQAKKKTIWEENRFSLDKDLAITNLPLHYFRIIHALSSWNRAIYVFKLHVKWLDLWNRIKRGIKNSASFLKNTQLTISKRNHYSRIARIITKSSNHLTIQKQVAYLKRNTAQKGRETFFSLPAMVWVTICRYQPKSHFQHKDGHRERKRKAIIGFILMTKPHMAATFKISIMTEELQPLDIAARVPILLAHIHLLCVS